MTYVPKSQKLGKEVPSLRFIHSYFRREMVLIDVQSPTKQYFTNVTKRGRPSWRKPVPKQTLAMFPGPQANFKDTVVQENGSNPQNSFFKRFWGSKKDPFPLLA